MRVQAGPQIGARTGPVCATSPPGDNDPMRPDIYTKAVLTVIAIMLTVIAVKPLINPTITASAQSAQFASVQFTGLGNGVSQFFDTRTGDVWLYGFYENTWQHLGKVTVLGQKGKTTK